MIPFLAAWAVFCVGAVFGLWVGAEIRSARGGAYRDEEQGV